MVTKKRSIIFDENMKIAIECAKTGIMNKHGGPFGAVVTCPYGHNHDEEYIIGVGHNEVLKNQDPTCHGEIQAIRNACKHRNSFDLSDCTLYTTAYPCPMCLGAIQWAGIKKVVYGCSLSDTASIGFNDLAFQDKSGIKFIQVDRDECYKVFESWKQAEGELY